MSLRKYQKKTGRISFRFVLVVFRERRSRKPFRSFRTCNSLQPACAIGLGVFQKIDGTSSFGWSNQGLFFRFDVVFPLLTFEILMNGVQRNHQRKKEELTAVSKLCVSIQHATEASSFTTDSLFRCFSLSSRVSRPSARRNFHHSRSSFPIHGRRALSAPRVGRAGGQARQSLCKAEHTVI